MNTSLPALEVFPYRPDIADQEAVRSPPGARSPGRVNDRPILWTSFSPARCSIKIPFAFAICSALFLVGCGGASEVTVAPVTGKVTLNGEPLPNAYVFFTPTELGRPSMGVTNEQGIYELTYRGNESGAVIGPHRVGISTVAPESTGTELVPDNYRTPDALSATVEAGSNNIDFALEGSSPNRTVGETETNEDDSV